MQLDISKSIGHVIQVEPDFISFFYIKDGFRLWDDREDGSQEVAEAALIPVLVKAIQELSAQVNSLTTRLEALEGR